MNYTITLTETENKALGYVALNQQDWMDNAIHERCRIAIDDIVHDKRVIKIYPEYFKVRGLRLTKTRKQMLLT